MEILRSFGIYETIAVFIPGVITLYFVDDFYCLNLLENSNFLILLAFSYVCGQLLQGISKLIESLYWKLWKGNPTEWMLSQQKNIYDNKLREKVLKSFKNEYGFELNHQNLFLIKEVANDDFRLQVFNTHYGLFRALGTIFAILVISYLLKSKIAMAGTLLIITIISLHRMHTFSVHYAKRLFAVFIEKTEKET